MKKLAVAVAVLGFSAPVWAADLPVKAPPTPVAAVPSWTGFYVGANVGGGWGDHSIDYSPNDPNTATLFNPPATPPGGGKPPSASITSSGALGGVQLGYNWQFTRNWVTGFETDFDWSGLKGSGSSSGTVVGAFPGLGLNPFTASVNESVKWFGTARARLGYLPTDNLLIYGTGGFAYGRVDRSGSYVNTSGSAFGILAVNGFSFFCATGATCFAGSSSSVAAGWTAGGGLEYALSRNLSLKGEYLYVSLDSKSLTEAAQAVITAGDKPSSFNANGRTSFNVARIGLNYRF